MESISANVFALVCTSVACVVVGQTPSYRKGLKRVNDHPGFRPLISPLSMAGLGTPYIRGIYPGFDMPWRGKHEVFANFGCDVISCVSLTGASILYLADADLIKKISGNQYLYPKPVENYGVLNLFGPNLVTASGHDWRRQQVVSRNVFNTRGWYFLWNETRGIFDGMMEANGWRSLPSGAEIKVDHAVHITLRVALLAIANAGFGMRMKWKNEDEVVYSPGHTMSFQSALHTVAQSSILKMALPKIAEYLPIPKVQHMFKAFSELEMYIQEMIKEKKAEILGEKVPTSPSSHGPSSPRFECDERADLFHNLVRASLSGEEPLTDEELQGNIYIYLLAGHETTAHSIAFTLALLSLWPEKQEELYKHIIQVMPADGVTSYDDYKRFDYVRAVYFETLRMFPPVQQIPKKVAQDTIFVFDKTNARNAEIGRAEERRRRVSQAQSCVTTPLTPTRIDTSFSDTSADSSTILNSDFSFSDGSDCVSTSTSATSIGSSADEDCDKELPGSFPQLAPLSTAPSSFSSIPTRPSLTRNKSFCKPSTERAPEDFTVSEEQTSLMVEKDTIVFICPPAVHYNPKYYPDPYDFKPERFLGKFDESTFLPFSSGTRVCLGRHFSEVESVCFIAYLMKEFSVHPVPAFDGETREQMKERMLKAIPLITLTPQHIPLIFRKRADST